jgi:hypothetical protein
MYRRGLTTTQIAATTGAVQNTVRYHLAMRTPRDSEGQHLFECQPSLCQELLINLSRQRRLPGICAETRHSAVPCKRRVSWLPTRPS